MSLIIKAIPSEICVQQINIKYVGVFGFFFFLLDPFQFLTKNEPAKEQPAQPALARKPTVIRIPAKPGKCKSFSQIVREISVRKSF